MVHHFSKQKPISDSHRHGACRGEAITPNGVAYPITWTDATHFVMRSALTRATIISRFRATIVRCGHSRRGNKYHGFLSGTQPDATGAADLSKIFYARQRTARSSSRS